jgi:hypothetical protein
MEESELTPAEIEFTKAFEANRLVLAGFRTCGSEEELHLVRDGWLLSLGLDLCDDEAGPLKVELANDPEVKEVSGTEKSFQATVKAARKSQHWKPLKLAVTAKASEVGTDLMAMWSTLEKGRLEWLQAASGAHGVKVTLKELLDKDPKHTEGDISDAKMLWMFSLAVNIPDLTEAVEIWRKEVNMEDKTTPLVGYEPDLWDPRKECWAPIDLGVQAAAERGGSSTDEAWDLM